MRDLQGVSIYGGVTMKDKFINATLFYEQIGGKLKEAMSDILSVNQYGNELYDTPWFPEDMKKRCSVYIGWSHDAWNALNQIKSIFEESKAVRKDVHVHPARKKIERITVIRGGLYEPPEVVTDDNPLTVQGATWLQKQRAKPENHKNA